LSYAGSDTIEIIRENIIDVKHQKDL